MNMIRYLINRPIAVLMAFTACMIIGLVTYFTLPISLLPDIAIPEITVQVTDENTSARELENASIRPLRDQLMQLSGLKELESQTRDGQGLVRLRFEHGTNTDLAFIEVNEKVDAAMNCFPKTITRPKVIKASAADLPVLYVNLSIKDEAAKTTNSTDGAIVDDSDFNQLSEFADNVIRRRLEQLSEVAMVDVTGIVKQEVRILPDLAKMATLGLNISDLEEVLKQNNVEPGSMRVRDGYYEYNIKLSAVLRTTQDIGNILFHKAGKIVRMGDFCNIDICAAHEQGLSISEGKRAVTMAIIKQADENMDAMKDAVSSTLRQFEQQYPHISFSIERNQTELLDFTISNLQQNLLLGFLFIGLVAVFFLGDIQSPIIIGISMLVSLIVSFLFFYLFEVSLNIISLSGLILALGMMIDSSIIVTENIIQYREAGCTLHQACIRGTSEVITPMLSSSLTTVAVFVPLVFMSGIAGALFFDQAFAVTVGLFVSYLTSIMLLPVLYAIVYGWKLGKKKQNNSRSRFQIPYVHTKHQMGVGALYRFYDRGVTWTFGHKRIIILFCVISLPLCVLMFRFIDKERMPQVEQHELNVKVEWNENIHVNENRRRVEILQNAVKPWTTQQSAEVGLQDYLLNSGNKLTLTEANLYVKVHHSKEVDTVLQVIDQQLKKQFPQAIATLTPPQSIFEKIFVTGEPDVTAQLYARNKARAIEAEEVNLLEQKISSCTGLQAEKVSFEEQLNIGIRHEQMLLYQVSYDDLYRSLRSLFKGNEVSTLHSFQQNLPISIVADERTVSDVLNTEFIGNVPLNELICVSRSFDLKTLTAGTSGEYLPLRYYDVQQPEKLMDEVRQAVGQSDIWDVSFSGGYFSNKQMMGEMVVILLVSIMLMYFILSAQFESFLQPLIVLLEVPVDIAFSLVLLWLCGHTLNLMSAIGLIVTCGIIINDSILKLDAINELRKTGMPLMEAIHEAGRRRLRSIVMTSLTTILAMVPLLFSHDMGSELQQPLSIAMIGAMGIGTLVSLFVVPLAYWYVYRKKDAHA